MRIINKQSTAFAATNLGLDARGMSNLWLSELNRKDRGENMFKCEVTNTHNNIKSMMQIIMSEDTATLTFSIAIDGTKVPKSLSTNTANKSIMGGACPNHLMSKMHLNKDETCKMLNNKKDDELGSKPIELDSEVKFATACFQNQQKSISHMAIISVLPQGVNETSTFASDVCKAASKIADEHNNAMFTNFATDGVSVEMKDIMHTLFSSLDGKTSCIAGVDNKHNVKNHRHQHIGGSNVASIRNTIIEVNVLLQANVSMSLMWPKHFSSDEKVEQLFSFGTLVKACNSFAEGTSIDVITLHHYSPFSLANYTCMPSVFCMYQPNMDVFT